MLTVLLFSGSSYAQLMINKGATIVTKPSSYMQVNGAYQNQTGSIDDSGTVTITTDFTNNSAATAGGSGLYNIGGNFTNDGTFVRKTGTVNLDGTSNQNVGGAVITTFYDLQFTNGGSKTLTQEEDVDSNCYFTSGVCYTTQTDILHFTTNGNWVNNSGMPTSSCASYVSGPCAKDVNSTNRFWFPVGKDGRANTCAITPSTSTATTFRTQYFDFPYTNTTSIQSPLMTVSKVQYWHGDITSGGTNAIIRLYWIPGDYVISWLQSVSNLVVARWDTLAPNPPGPRPAWVTAGVSALSPTATWNSGWIESATVTTAQYGTSTINRPFTLASLTADNSLPVEVGRFVARQQNNHVVLDWKTYSEIQNLGFEIEREKELDGSAPGASMQSQLIKSFVTDSELRAKSPWGAEYETIDDNSLVTGRYTYRLYQIDLNGVRTQVGLQTVDFNELAIPKALEVTLYPNPVANDANVEFAMPQESYVTFAIYDITGREVQRGGDGEYSAGPHTVSFDVSRLSPGTYTLDVCSGFTHLSKKFVVGR